MMYSTRYKNRAAAAVITLLAVIVSILVAPATPAAAIDYYCPDAPQHSPPNNLDWCFVRHSDYNQNYVAEMTMYETDCSSTTHTYYRLRVRIVGDYLSAGDKFRVRQFSIRYLSGTKPWIYFQVHVTDGNLQPVNRDWNYNGGWIRYDGAGQYVNNTTNLYPPSFYAPVFGSRQEITFQIDIRESDGPLFPYSGYCTGGAMFVQMKPSALP